MSHGFSHRRGECGRHRSGERFAHGPFDRGMRGMHGGRGRRLLDHGDLRFVILHLLADKPRHGYDLIKAIEEKLAGAYSPSPGVVYPTLTMLEEMGYATVAATEGTRKLYALTEEGRAFLDANRATVEAVFARIAEVSDRHGGGVSPQLLRAMENLKLALRLRLSRGRLAEEEVRRIAALLDEAATAVERS